MVTNYQAELVGLFGKPVSENPTGVMQEAAFAALGLNWRYITVEVEPDNLADAVIGARAFGLKGFNLTIPHKVAVMEYLDELSIEAKIIGAVNTVRRDGTRLIGDNTDGKGFLRALTTDAGFDPVGKNAVMIGAGGAARAIGTELALAGLARLHIVNRSRERVEKVASHLESNTNAKVSYEIWDGTYTVPDDTDVFINATSIGLYPDVDAMPPVDFSIAKKDMVVCDAVFNPAETKLLQYANSFGLQTLDGLSMLVYQGVLGFEMWTGEEAPEAVMKEALQQAMGDQS